MGGIPWTSAACKNCKKSKVRCDLKEPECTRCIRRRTPCPGYEGRIFVQQTFPQATSRNPSGKRKSVQIQSRADPWRLPQAVNSGGQECMQISACYLNSAFSLNPTDGCGSSPWYGHETWRSVVVTCVQLPETNQRMLEKAVTAISCVYLGKMNKDELILRRGTQLYNQAIRLLADRIQKNVFDDRFLYATIIFQMIEVIDCPQGIETWIAHRSAANFYFKKHLRLGFDDNILKRSIFGSHQRAAIVYFNARAQPINEEFRYLMNFQSENILDEIFKFYISIASLQGTVDEMTESDFTTGKATLDACLSLKKRMTTWYTENLSEIGGPPHCSSLGKSPQSSISPADHLFGPHYHFSSLHNGVLHVYYWAGLVRTESLVRQAHAALISTSDFRDVLVHSPDYLPDENYAIAEHYGDEICRAIPFCLQGKMNLWGVQTGMTSCIIHAIQPYIHLRRQEKFKWCQSVLQVSIDHGMGLTLHFQKAFSQMWEAINGPSTGEKTTLPVQYVDPDIHVPFPPESHPRITDVTKM